MLAARSREAVKPPAQKEKVESLGKRPEFNSFWCQLVTRSSIQSKLAVSQPGDPYEQEADQMADQVMRTSAPALQRTCATCETGGAPCPKCDEEKAGLVQRKAESVVRSEVRSAPTASTAPIVVQRQPDDAPKPPEQPTQFPPQEASKQGQEKEDYEKARLLEGAKKAAGEFAKYLWAQFSTSQTGRNILDKNEKDLKPLIKFFEDFADSILGKFALGAVAAGGVAGAFAGAYSARDTSSEPGTSPSTGGPVAQAPKDEKFFSLELKWDFVTPPTSFTLKTPWVDTPPLGGSSKSGSSTSPPPPLLTTFKPLQIPRICTPEDPNGDQGEADARSATVYAWLKYRQEQEQKRQEELLKKYTDWPKPPQSQGGPYADPSTWQPSVLKPLFKRRDGAQEIYDPSAVDVGLRSPGQPLDPTTLAYMRLRFHRDFSEVRVHTDTQAATSAHTLNAHAYTLGRDIVFGSGQYQPQAESGQRLLAHELTHVLQQRAAGLTLQRDEKEEKPARVNVALVLDDSETTMAAASALALRTIRVYSVEDMKTKLQGLGVPIDTLYVLSHSNRSGEVQFTGQSGGISWAKLSDIATKLKGVLPADKAPVVIDFRGCQLGEAPEELGKVRQAVGASSARATNCWTFDAKTTPLTASGVPITEESQVTKENQAEFDKNLKQLINQLTTDDGKPVKNCIIGLGANEQADANLTKIKKLYFANKGRLVAQWVSPEYNKNWQEGSKCFKNLTNDENAKCRLVTAEAEIPTNEQTSETRVVEAETGEGAGQAVTFEEEMA